jgi:hypothetical protein
LAEPFTVEWRNKLIWMYSILKGRSAEADLTVGFTAATTPPTGVTFSTNNGKYTEIAGWVFFSGQATLSSKGAGGVGAIRYSLPAGVPVAALPYALTIASFDFINLNAGYTTVGANMVGGTNTFGVSEMGDNVAAQAVTWANVANNTDIIFSGFYPK